MNQVVSSCKQRNSFQNADIELKVLKSEFLFSFRLAKVVVQSHVFADEKKSRVRDNVIPASSLSKALLPFPEVLLLPVRVRCPSGRKSIFPEADVWRTSRSPRRTRIFRKIWPTVRPSVLSRGLSVSDSRLETKLVHLPFLTIIQTRAGTVLFARKRKRRMRRLSAHRRITEFWHIWFFLGGPPSSTE